MPNHVFNSMSVTGSPEAIKAFTEKAKHTRQDQSREFSYWNFVTPPQEAVDSGEYDATRGFVAGEESGFTANNWYEFNTREWGTKWDAYDIDVQVAPKSFFATFTSAWSPPTQVFEAIVAQHPELTFDFHWEEEQGWGGESVGNGGYYAIVREWDIPDSHADYLSMTNESSCVCAWSDDQEEWYDDCPRPNDDDGAGIDD